MKNNDLPGLSPLWLISLALVLGVCLVMAIPLLLSSNSINSTAWIGFSGNIIGGAIALTAVVAASINVGRQLRVNLMSREEDRMERDLPGLREASAYLSNFSKAVRGKHSGQIRSINNSLNRIEHPHDRLDEAVRKQVPTAPRRVQDRIVADIVAIDRQARRVSDLRKQLTDASDRLDAESTAGADISEIRTRVAALQPSFTKEQDNLSLLIGGLESTANMVVGDIIRFEKRLAEFRPQIERYFKD